MHLLEEAGFKPNYGSEQSFTRADVADMLHVTTAPATVLIRKMKDAALIELANGKSRGTYRFKPV